MITEGTITHTLVMTFKDAAGSVRSLKVPNARPNLTGREVRQVMEQIAADGIFLSRKGLPLVKLVRATLVTVRWIFVAEKTKPAPVKEEKAEAKEETPAAQEPSAAPAAPAAPQAASADRSTPPLKAPFVKSAPLGAEVSARPDNLLYFPHPYSRNGDKEITPLSIGKAA